MNFLYLAILPALLLAAAMMVLLRYLLWIWRGGTRVVVPWIPTGEGAGSPFAQRLWTRDGTAAVIGEPGCCDLLLWKLADRVSFDKRCIDRLTGSSSIGTVSLDCGIEIDGLPYVITSVDLETRHGRVNGPHYASFTLSSGPAVARLDISRHVDPARLLADLRSSIANPAIRHKSAAHWLSYFLGWTRADRVTCSGLIGNAILRQPESSLAQALREALRLRFAPGEISPGDLARAAALLGLAPRGTDSPVRAEPLQRGGLGWKVGLAGCGVLALLIAAFAQSAGPTPPFATTPSIQAFTSSGVTLLVRKPDNSYGQLQFGISAPYGLLSSAASLASVISGSSSFNPNAPAGPANVGRASQGAALADFNGDGSPGVACGGPLANNPNSVTVYEGTPGFLFRGAQTYPIGPYVGGVIAADFNGDGKIDLAVPFAGNNSPGGVAILLNKGGGTFAAPVVYSAGSGPISVATLDVNHDGKLDLAVADNLASPGRVWVLLGNGDGTFGAATGYPTGPNPLSVTIADFNGDGNPDLAVTALDSSVTILLGNGHGTFSAGSSIQGEGAAQYVAAGDFNGDGKLDLVTANTNAQTVSIFLGDGAGNFALKSTYTTSYSPETLIVTDYNGDGHLDIVQGLGDARGMGAGLDSEDIDILLGNGDGTFQGDFTVSAPATNPSPTFMATGDFNGDGKIDAIVNDQFASNLYLFAGAGGGTFQSPVKIDALATNGQTGPAGAAPGDFNGDGKLDLAVTEKFVGNVAVLLNSAAGLQLSGSFPSGGTNPGNVVTADFNQDGKLDLAVVNAGPLDDVTPGNLTVFFGGGNGAFTLNQTYSAGLQPNGLAVADVNGDGYPDLIVTDVGSYQVTGAVYVFLNNGKGGFLTPQKLSASAFPIFVSVGDVNGDGKPDLVVGTEDRNVNFYLAIFLGAGNGTFGPGTLIPTEFGVAAVAIADFNGDGKADLAVAHCCGETDMTYLQGNGNGTFSSEMDFNGGPSPFAVVATDLNGDGKPDLIVGGNTSASVTALLNNSSPAASVVNSASFAANAIVAPNSIATVFGTHLASGNTLSSTAVAIQDSSGASQTCTLFAVTTGQVNFLVPGVAIGPATVTVTSADGVVSRGTFTVAPVAPGIYTAGSNLLDGFYQAIDAQGNQGPLSYTVQANPSSPGTFLPVPISLTPQTSTVYLILFGTGIRGAPQSQVTIQAGSQTLTPLYAGSQGQFLGFDQVNVVLPYSLKGSGDVPITVTAAGQAANTVHITVQ